MRLLTFWNPKLKRLWSCAPAARPTKKPLLAAANVPISSAPIVLRLTSSCDALMTTRWIVHHFCYFCHCFISHTFLTNSFFSKRGRHHVHGLVMVKNSYIYIYLKVVGVLQLSTVFPSVKLNISKADNAGWCTVSFRWWTHPFLSQFKIEKVNSMHRDKLEGGPWISVLVCQRCTNCIIWSPDYAAFPPPPNEILIERLVSCLCSNCSLK